MIRLYRAQSYESAMYTSRCSFILSSYCGLYLIQSLVTLSSNLSQHLTALVSPHHNTVWALKAGRYVPRSTFADRLEVFFQGVSRRGLRFRMSTTFSILFLVDFNVVWPSFMGTLRKVYDNIFNKNKYLKISSEEENFRYHSVSFQERASPIVRRFQVVTLDGFKFD